MRSEKIRPIHFLKLSNSSDQKTFVKRFAASCLLNATSYSWALWLVNKQKVMNFLRNFLKLWEIDQRNLLLNLRKWIGRFFLRNVSIAATVSLLGFKQLAPGSKNASQHDQKHFCCVKAYKSNILRLVQT